MKSIKICNPIRAGFQVSFRNYLSNTCYLMSDALRVVIWPSRDTRNNYDILRIVTDACVPLQRNTFWFSLASSQLIFVVKKRILYSQSWFLDPDHILRSQLLRLLNVNKKRVKSRRTFVPSARNY